MHRTFDITVPETATPWLVRELEALEHVVALVLHRGASINPPGDVLTVHVLNKGADDVLKCVDAARTQGAISIATAEVASLIDPRYEQAVHDDVDEAIWEEMETGLRHQGRVTANFLVLMALGGAIAATGLVSEPGPQTISFVAASNIAPGFEPIPKVPLGLVLRQWKVVRRGLVSTAVG